jgi:hypothetical protein
LQHDLDEVLRPRAKKTNLCQLMIFKARCNANGAVYYSPRSAKMKVFLRDFVGANATDLGVAQIKEKPER